MNTTTVPNGVLLPLPVREIQVDEHTGRKPKTVARLADWEYLEKSIYRLLCGWGRFFGEWDDITAVHRHVWEQTECVRRLRERAVQFPGTTGNVDAPVSPQLEKLVNTVLLAPSHQDAVDGIYHLLIGALTASYLDYGQKAHPVHDAPTVAMLHEIVGIKEQMRLWLRSYRRRYPHTTDAEYSAAIARELEACGHLLAALPVKGEGAAPAGVNTDFRLPLYPALPANSRQQHDIMPFLRVDFPHSIEARRLFWAYAYMLEMNLAIDQLRWLYDGHFMPWEWHQDVSRHLWDESRHGDSGHSRLSDFGITIQEIGFATYGPQERDGVPLSAPQQEVAGGIYAQGEIEPMGPQELYDAVFGIGLIAETGHFVVKREAYDDFKQGGDMESAEMMIFDIIDETTHVQYAHKWLPLLAEKAGINASNYKELAAAQREKMQREHDEKFGEGKQAALDTGTAAYAFYQSLLQKMRAQKPLSNAQNCPPRSPLPM